MNDTPRCRTCRKVPPKVLDQTWEDWETMRYCGPECDPKAQFAAEVTWLIAGGAGWGEICRQMNLNPAALTRRLLRYGRADLARHFNTALVA